MVHHVPNIAIVPCLGCGELVDETNLFREFAHGGHSCCTFHPYHARCYRSAPPDPRPWTACARCGTTLATADVLAATRWLADFDVRLHPEKYSGRAGAKPCPASLRFVRVRQPGRHVPKPLALAPLFGGGEREVHEWFGRRYELVHSDCA